ncbi:MAG: metallopeptidase TldD-related protein [Rubrivivax sp.]
MDFQPGAAAEQVLQRLRTRGFEQAQVTVGETRRCELNLAHNQPSLLRSNESRRVSATGIVGGRRASAEGTDLGDEGIASLIDELWAAAASAPADDANAVSAGQQLQLAKGPQQADPQALAQSLRQLLDWRAAHTPTMVIEEALAAHVRSRSHTLTSGGSSIAADIGWCELSVFGLARDGSATSSFNHAGGVAHVLDDVPQRFGVARMMSELTRQVHPRRIGDRFVGDVVLAPGAVADLLDWLMGQLRDGPLIDGSSLYRQRVGERIASPLLTLRSRYDGPGCTPLTGDAFVAPPATLLDAGTLTQLAPSLYGSRKTGLPHRPLAGDGWELLPGATPLAGMIAAVPRGALVDRLSMGHPAPNGDFSGVIKNSFAIDGGQVGDALAETMISGNVAQMLQAVSAVSTERIDSGSHALPWLRVGGLHFS